MSTPVIAFFNNTSGVGKTTLVYHLSWMYADLGLRVVAADLDPQAGLTATFLDEEYLNNLWLNDDHSNTIYGAINSRLVGFGYPVIPHLEDVGKQQFSLIESPLALLAGDLSLSLLEDQLANLWSQCLNNVEQAYYGTTAIEETIQGAATMHKADIVLMDLGSNLSAINRAALIAADYIVTPLSLDLLSLQGLYSLGPTLNNWRQEWRKRLTIWKKLQNAKTLPAKSLHVREKSRNRKTLPAGNMLSIGYVLLQHAVRLDRPIQEYERWLIRIPREYHQLVLGEEFTHDVVPITDDSYCLALLKKYYNLMALAREARKPMFSLKPADGALGSHMQAALGAYTDFQQLATKIAERVNLPFPK